MPRVSAQGNAPSPNGQAAAAAGPQVAGRPTTVFSNYYQGTKGRSGYSVQEIAGQLRQQTGGWPRRVDRVLFARGLGGKPLWLETPADLFAWIAGEMRPGNAFNPVEWALGPRFVGEQRFFAYLRQTVQEYDAVELYPHFPPLPRTYYPPHMPALGGAGGALADLLKRYQPATAVDADLLLAVALTLFWGGPPGARPAFLVTSEDNATQAGPGSGKSSVVKTLARLVGGHIDLAPHERMPDIITRLLSPNALAQRVVLLDNVKALKFSWAELESLITNDAVSGHRLYTGQGNRPNTLVYTLTLNGAALSRDMAQRCVVVVMKRPTYSAAWEKDTIAFIEARRSEIIGDILAALQGPARGTLPGYTRWGTWEGDVLTRVSDPAGCQRVIRERQEYVDDDANEAGLVREYIVDALGTLGHQADNAVVFIPSAELADWANAALGERRPVPRAIVHLRTLAIPELRYCPRGSGRGWVWRGVWTTPGQAAVPLRRTP
jgi:hypothetical protein